MKKLLSLSLLAMIISFASYAFPITGTPGTCVGTYGYLSDSLTGGTWSSSNVAVATVDPSGNVLGISAGTATISYIAGGVTETVLFTVGTHPATISGTPLSGCIGYTATLTDATPGGTWSSSDPSVASIDPATGVLTTLSAGFSYINYSVSTGCSSVTMDTVYGAPAVDSITGPTTVCPGSTITLYDITSGGVWTSSNPSVATISGGVVTGVAPGTAVITYTVTGPCGSSSAAYAVTVTSAASAGTISGAATLSVGSTTTLTDGVAGGTWSSSNPSVANVSGSGVVTGYGAGVVTITYTVIGCSGSLTATHTITVTGASVNRISGHILFTGPATDSLTPITVWLIHYNPATHLLSTVDSMTTFTGGTSAYYYFTGAVADSYRVKAAYTPATFTGTGYIPTYYTSSFYWYSATAFYHAAATADDNKDITMAYGTVTAGAGFIAGDVTTGANRGTAGTIPSVGLLVYVRNASGSILQQAYTNAAGHYSFSNLPVGASYSIYPEDMNYHTTAFTGINLTAAAPSMSAANFGQHSISKTILPATTGIINVPSSVSSVNAFPNPASGKLNIQWNESADETATVTVNDITGRVVYASAIRMNQGSGSSQIDISGLTNGVYLLSVKSGTINYNNKIQVQK